jgi:hypothetical protein
VLQTYLCQFILSNDSKARLHSALIEIFLYLYHSDSALFSSVMMSFVTWQSSVVTVSENYWRRQLLICVLAVVFLIYPTESVIGQSVLYYFLHETVDATSGWNEVGECVAVRAILSFSLLCHLSANMKTITPYCKIYPPQALWVIIFVPWKFVHC